MIDNNSRAGSFGQIQIIAKTLLTVSGIFIFERILGDFTVLIPSFFHTPTTASFSGLLLYGFIYFLLLSAVALYMIFNNNWLVKRILPNEEPPPIEKYEIWLYSSLRIGLVFCSLVILISLSLNIVNSIIYLPSLIRYLFSNAKPGSFFTKLDFVKMLGSISTFFKLALTLYMITGANGFIKWQINQTEFKNKKG